MGHTLAEIRNALASTINQQTSAAVYTYAQVQSRGNFPAVIIEPEESDFSVAFKRGADEWVFNLYVLVRGADDALMQKQLDTFVTGDGPDSIRRVLFDNRTLGLEGVSAHVYKMEGYGYEFKWEGTQHMGAKLKVRVVVTN